MLKLKLFLNQYALSHISLLNKIVKDEIEVMKTVNLLYQIGSFSKDIILNFDMYLQPCVWYSLGEIIGLSDKTEMCALYDQNSTYSYTVYIFCDASFLPHCFFPVQKLNNKIFVVYWLCSLRTSTCAPLFT